MSAERPRGSGELRRALAALSRELPGLGAPVFVVALILCLLVPLPTPVVDLLLSLSLATAALVLVASLRVRRAVEFLSFPTLVLLLALYRLALNVSTTRLILSQADAGRVVDAFSELVVRGDLLIGVVMFAVITAIQYVVIARGAERVAEVAARFALDGMPGQQAAIDADLRSGAIGAREAAARRAALVERSDFFGRMDGVMRWVKGDAIVGLLITATNLVGGLAVGATRAGLGVGESLALYGKLAIGDGLLAQVPALLISLAAALLVARVDRSRAPGPDASWLEPAMLVVPAGLLAVLAAIPGMPTLAFASTAVGLVALALFLAARRPPAPDRDEPRIRVRARIGPASRVVLARELAGLRRRCELDLGVAIPRLELEPIELAASEGDAPAPVLDERELELRLGERVLARERWLPAADATGGGGDDGRARGELDAMVLACFHGLMANAEVVVELAQIEAEIEAIRAREPGLVRQALRAVEPVDVLTIVRAFVRERVPLPSTKALLRALAEGRTFHDPSHRPSWPERAREALADHWVMDVCDALERVGRTRWLRPSLDLEDALLARCELDEGRPRLHLPAAERARLIERFGADETAAILCSSRARPVFAALLAGRRPHLPVIAAPELRAAGRQPPPTTVLDLE